jgi:outer membrane biosynthesis protein TonB
MKHIFMRSRYFLVLSGCAVSLLVFADPTQSAADSVRPAQAMNLAQIDSNGEEKAKHKAKLKEKAKEKTKEKTKEKDKAKQKEKARKKSKDKNDDDDDDDEPKGKKQQSQKGQKSESEVKMGISGGKTCPKGERAIGTHRRGGCG